MKTNEHHMALHPEGFSREAGGRLWSGCHWPGSGESTLFLHGFSGSCRDVEGLVHYRTRGASVFSIDLPGHSGTPFLEGGIWEWAKSVNHLVEELAESPMHLVGYSMGGRLAMRMALLAPDLFSRLSLISASPGLEGDRTDRRGWDAGIAREARTLDIGEFADRWESLPILRGATEAEEPWASRLATRRRTQDGELLARVMEEVGAGEVEPVWNRLEELTVRTQLLAGTRDTKYVGIVKRMAALLPNGQLHIVEEAGHCLHVEAPAKCAHLVGL